MHRFCISGTFTHVSLKNSTLKTISLALSLTGSGYRCSGSKHVQEESPGWDDGLRQKSHWPRPCQHRAPPSDWPGILGRATQRYLMSEDACAALFSQPQENVIILTLTEHPGSGWHSTPHLMLGHWQIDAQRAQLQHVKNTTCIIAVSSPADGGGPGASASAIAGQAPTGREWIWLGLRESISSTSSKSG